MEEPEKHSSNQQKAQAGGDILQVGRDYIRQVQVNFNSGNWLIGVVALIPLLLLLYGGWKVIEGVGTGLVVSEADSEPVETASENEASAMLTNGRAQVMTLNLEKDQTIWLQAATPDSLMAFFVNAIPLQDYQNGTFKINGGSNLEGMIAIQGATYSINAVDTDLTISFESNPVTAGEFVRAKVTGTVTGGKTVNFEIVVPMQG